MKLTQHDLILKYVERFGSITPAKLSDADRAAIPGGFIGSEARRRCIELEKKGELEKVQGTGKFGTWKKTNKYWTEFTKEQKENASNEMQLRYYDMPLFPVPEPYKKYP